MRGLRRRSSGEDDARGVGSGAGDEPNAEAEAADEQDAATADPADPETGPPGLGADTETDDVGGEDPSDDAAAQHEDSPQRKWKRLLFPAVSAVLIVALVVVAGLLLWQRYGGDDSTAASAADIGHDSPGNLTSPYIDKADMVVLDIVNASPDTAEKNAQEVLDNSIGDFHDVYAGARDQYLAMVTGSEATSEGKIIQSGLESIDGTKATVLVLASTEVTNKSVSEPSRRDFRLRVTVEKQGDDYKVSSLEQVV
ncbi:MAG: hypothetical protein L0H59_02180 [Tomitella sp.]|nr:hypothetical protein [Tomitella sp.]